MIPPRLIRKALTGWFCWRSRRALHRAYPWLSDLDIRERACRAGHRRGAASVIAAKRTRMTAELARRAV